MRPTLTRKARAGILAGAVALIATGAAATLPAGAQPSPTLTVSPPTIPVGASSQIVATECTADVDPADLYVQFASDPGGPGSETVPVVDGTATWNTGNAPVGSEGSYAITASCVVGDGEVFDTIFEYTPATLTVVVIPETTTTTSPSTTTTAPSTTTTTAPAGAAPAVTVAPTFTG